MRGRALIAAFTLAIAPAAYAADDTVDVPCGPLSSVDHGKFRTASHDEWMALRVTFYMAPGTPTSFPPGDTALVRENEDGSATVVFVDGGDVCAPLRLTAEAVDMLKDIRKRKVTHAKGKM